MEIHNPLQFASGLLGNIISFMVFLAPLPTFYRICKKRSTEGFQSIPYVIALFSSTLWMYYAFLKWDAYLLITINSFGFVIETIYISIFLAYAPKAAKILTAKLLLGLNLGVFCVILVITNFLIKGPNRVCVLGWICVAFSASVFAAPLSVMRLVLRTKSVEFMPFGLSFFLTLSAISWFSYGFLLKDIYIALPNVLGFLFGVVQMGLYAVYRNNRGKTEVKVVEENKEHVIVVELTRDDENEVEKVIEPKPIDSVGSNVQCALDKASAVIPASSCQNMVCVEV